MNISPKALIAIAVAAAVIIAFFVLNNAVLSWG